MKTNNKSKLTRRKFIHHSFYVTTTLIASNLVLPGLLEESAYAQSRLEVKNMVKNISWFDQASIKINTGQQVVYIDPVYLEPPKGQSLKKADIILITHQHGDHFSEKDISKIITTKTKIIAPKGCNERIRGSFSRDLTKFSIPGMNTTIEGVKIEAVPAYNIKKNQFHPKSNQWVGYIITVNGIKIYHAGDTERIPEMKDFICDIALLPLGQTYTMNSVEDAAQSALDVKASMAIPMHYGMYEGTEADANKFVSLLKGKTDTQILTKERFKS